MSGGKVKKRTPAITAREGSGTVTMVAFNGTNKMSAEEASTLAFRLSLAAEKARLPQAGPAGHHD